MLVAVRMCPPPGTHTEHLVVIYLLARRASVTRVPLGARSPLWHRQEAARTLIPGVHNLPQGGHLRVVRAQRSSRPVVATIHPQGPVDTACLLGPHWTLYQLLNNLP